MSQAQRPKAVALLSGGLDSTLAVKTMLEQGIDVTAVAIKTPFCDFDCGKSCGVRVKQVANQLGVRLKVVQLGREYLDIVRDPKHGRGRGMNPCIDCRSMMFRAAKEVMDEVGATFLVTGEVLDQRPMSQTMRAIEIIDKESGMEGRVLRPLSARRLEPTQPEREGLVNREALHDIAGRSRKRQIQMAEDLGIKDYPNSAGGCLLTEPGFSRKVRDLLEHERNPDLNDTEILKVGRHFRLTDDCRLIVGRDEKENARLEGLSRDGDICLQVRDYVGPLAILRGKASAIEVELAAGIVQGYSDAPKGCANVVSVRENSGTSSETYAAPIDEPVRTKYRI